ncbi:hypothetical protein BVY01_00320 [bacterium I07]|nr:hypothetical protein BVY01_00320 [bacterium I07]
MNNNKLMMRNRFFIQVASLLLFLNILAAKAMVKEPDRVTKKRSISAFPILIYDSDIGIGFGGKGVVKNHYHRDESFDLMIFFSTKGEQKYSFIFSCPDIEIRRGEKYDLALDVKLEFNKLLKSNFFGIGNSTINNEFQFPKESSKLEITLSRAFSKSLVAELFFRTYHFSIYGYNPAWGTLNTSISGVGESGISSVSLKLLYDTRDSHINAKNGVRVGVTADRAFRFPGTHFSFSKIRLESNYYRQLFGWKPVMAFRIWMEGIQGEAPFYELCRIGDGWTARGYKADRFIDKTMMLSTLEYRVPLFRKIGSVIFIDAGRVWPSVSKWSFTNWHANVGVGLRYYLENFVARFDVGFSSEGTRIFFNFGHVF